MKFTCEKHLLQAAVNTASRAAAGKSPIPALEGLLVEAGTSVRITGYDLKKGIYTKLPADVTEPGSIILSARLFGEIVRSLPEGIVTIATGKSNMTTISCGSSDFSILGTDSDDYPELPSVEQHNSITLPQKTLKEMVGQTLFAVSENESRPIYTGSLFDLSGNTLTVVSVDGYRLALRREEIQRPEGEDRSFIVPGTALSDMEKICGNTEEPVCIHVGVKHISFSVGDTVLISRRLEGDFLNYKKSVPTSFNVKVTADRAVLTRTVERVSLIIDDKIRNPLRCVFDGSEIKLTCVTSLGKAEDICPVDGEGNGLEIGFNNRYLLDALKVAPAEKLKLCLNNGSSPCVLVDEEEGDKFLYMILPVRLKAGD